MSTTDMAVPTTKAKRWVKHHESLTTEQRQLVQKWLVAAVAACRLNDRQISRRAGLGNTTLRTWLNGNQVPSRAMLDWLSEVTEHPLPAEVRELGAKMGHFSNQVKKRQEILRSRKAPLPVFVPDDEDETLPFPIDRDALVNQIMDNLAQLAAAPEVSYEAVLTWLSAHGPELTTKQRLALVAPLMTNGTPSG